MSFFFIFRWNETQPQSPKPTFKRMDWKTSKLDLKEGRMEVDHFCKHPAKKVKKSPIFVQKKNILG